MKKILLTGFSLILIISLCSCALPEIPTADTTAESKYTVNTSAEQSTTVPHTDETALTTTEPATELSTETVTDMMPTDPPAPPPTAYVPETEAEETTMGKTGEMAFSDDPDNRYIKAVADKYNVDPQKLVALYTVPQNDSNTVLEFSGKTDSSGKIIRNSSTLVAVYTIDAELNSQCASKDSSKNEYDSGEMMVMFFAVTTYIMPEFENELNG